MREALVSRGPSAGIVIVAALALLPSAAARAAVPEPDLPRTRQEAVEQMKPYGGKHVKGVDTATLTGKVMCGYQGWFAADGDGSELGWRHYGGGRRGFEPGNCTFDLWPDLSDMTPDERYPAPFKHADGRQAMLFSPYNPRTVRRHFEWMAQYGIDGVFLQRFGSSLRNPKHLNHRNVVTANVQAGANATGRTWAMMYDLSGLRPGDIERLIIPDWKNLIDRTKITRDKSYLHHAGKPLVAVWGVGFNDGRAYTLAECDKLVKFLKSDPTYGGATVMLGVPTGWRTRSRDAVADPMLDRIIRQADIVSPWSVGRYRSPAGAIRHGKAYTAPDIAWCNAARKDYLPVIFPGFSWHNLHAARGISSKLDQIPRRKGAFLWSQAVAAKQAGAKMLYVAMFDEIDEGTAIFKCTNAPPIGASPFLTYEGLRPDHYLWLTGQIGRGLRSTAPMDSQPPQRTK